MLVQAGVLVQACTLSPARTLALALVLVLACMLVSGRAGWGCGRVQVYSRCAGGYDLGGISVEDTNKLISLIRIGYLIDKVTLLPNPKLT
jgi:hypothetical protein